MIRIGQGLDVHPFDESRPLVLGGAQISERGGLAGHSDADAALHAVTDALLGAVAAGDIGELFPSSDPRWRGEPSSTFVHAALERVRAAGGVVVNLDVTIVAERPRLAPYRARIRESIARVMNVDAARVSVKATTTDHLGFLGRGEGLAVLAIAAVEIP